ncbi:MAG: LysR substrate-binding domain-containing protein [Rhodoblastus sp.]
MAMADRKIERNGAFQGNSPEGRQRDGRARRAPAISPAPSGSSGGLAPQRAASPVKRPSLNALRALEATARLSSMTAAAEELSVTHGAISRHIKSLEDMFGVALLVRGARAVQATPEGGRLAMDLTSAFALINASVEQLQPGPLTLSCSSTIMMSWLIPRIGGFHARYPDTELQFNMNYDRIDFVRDKISVAIRNNVIEPPKDVVIKDLIDEWIGPVCSPDYLAAKSVKSPADLARCALLSTKTRPNGWQDWICATGVDINAKPQNSYDHFYLLIQAAACGLGFAMAPKMLVLDDLRSGKLVAPFGFIPGPNKLVLWIAPHLRLRADTRALADWLTSEFRKPGMQGEAIEPARRLAK